MKLTLPDGTVIETDTASEVAEVLDAIKKCNLESPTPRVPVSSGQVVTAEMATPDSSPKPTKPRRKIKRKTRHIKFRTSETTCFRVMEFIALVENHRDNGISTNEAIKRLKLKNWQQFGSMLSAMTNWLTARGFDLNNMFTRVADSQSRGVKWFPGEEFQKCREV